MRGLASLAVLLAACTFAGAGNQPGGDGGGDGDGDGDGDLDAAIDSPALVASVVRQAEGHDELIERNESSWVEASDRAGASGSYMVTTGEGVCDAGDCAELVFELFLEGPATYFAHFRAFAANGGSDSLYWWVDAGDSSVQDFNEFAGQWQYRSTSLGELGPGMHVLHISKRDGIELDYIAVDQNMTPPL
jgi:hypothetical protein